jgi:single-strand DNA-binding protein
MAELNKVLLIGRLTRDPELRYTPGGMAVADFRMAVNHTYRVKEEKREEVCFIDINVLGRSAEVVKEYLGKGREVFIEGRIQLNSWENPQGEKRSKYRVVADRFQFLGGRGEGGAKPDRQAAVDPESFDPDPPQAEAEASADDDLPF